MTLVGAGFLASDALVVRVQGAHESAATFISHSMAVISTPPFLSPGAHAVETSRNGVHFSLAGVHIEVASAAPDETPVQPSVSAVVLSDVLPSFGPAGGFTRISVVGEGFSSGLACVFRSRTSSADVTPRPSGALHSRFFGRDEPTHQSSLDVNQTPGLVSVIIIRTSLRLLAPGMRTCEDTGPTLTR